jgi:hypothetical protein
MDQAGIQELDQEGQPNQDGNGDALGVFHIPAPDP